MELRAYQTAALDSLFAYWADGGDGALLEMATGCGKSLVIAELSRRLVTTYADFRISAVTHSQELIQQNHDELRNLWLAAPSGIYSAGLNRRERAQITFCGIQSIYNKAELLGRVDLLLVDEAHLIPRKSATMYGKFIAALRDTNPDMRIVGLTATPYRLSTGRLDEGEDRLFDSTVYTYGIADGVRDGYLARLTSKGMETRFDLTGVQKKGGEYVEKQLQAAVDKNSITKRAMEEAIAYGRERKSWLAFCSGVQHAYHVRDEVKRRGFTCETITGTTPASERAAIIKDFKAGKIRCLTNNSVLTTGFNAPGVDMIMALRPTASPGLYVQMAGRGTRTALGKDNCISEGSLVLTDVGLVEIQLVTTNMKVWDGINFVPHDGVIYKGEQNVISYAGLTATGDHQVWTRNGWLSFKECSETKASIAVTGNGWIPLQESYGYFSNDHSERKRKSIFVHPLREMWRGIKTRVHEFNEKCSWMQAVWKSSNSPEMAICSMSGCLLSVLQHQRSSLQRLRRQGDSIRFSDHYGYGVSYDETPRLPKMPRNRQGRQQFSLLINKSEMGDSFRKHDESKVIKKRVYDIANAGILRRFTVNGLLVSNCLVLDFARLIETHGPVDDIRPPKSKGGGIAPIKECPTCHTLIPAASRECPECGHVFEPLGVPHEPKITAKASNLSIMKGQPDDPPTWLQVTGRTFAIHHAPDKPPSVLTKFKCGIIAHKRWYAPARSSKGHFYADRFWFEHGGDAPAPYTAEEWLERQDELRDTEQISVKPDGKYFRVDATKAASALVLAL